MPSSSRDQTDPRDITRRVNVFSEKAERVCASTGLVAFQKLLTDLVMVAIPDLVQFITKDYYDKDFTAAESGELVDRAEARVNAFGGHIIEILCNLLDFAVEVQYSMCSETEDEQAESLLGVIASREPEMGLSPPQQFGNLLANVQNRGGLEEYLHTTSEQLQRIEWCVEGIWHKLYRVCKRPSDVKATTMWMNPS